MVVIIIVIVIDSKFDKMFQVGEVQFGHTRTTMIFYVVVVQYPVVALRDILRCLYIYMCVRCRGICFEAKKGNDNQIN